ncbi:MAG: FmdE family protein [Gammaproteobacteria bacterium]|nr:FmdE family protein [Gammaproteobacteria bacterium]
MNDLTANSPVPADLLDAGLMLHGHKCPAMPMGLRAGLAALEALGAERAHDGQLMALVDLGDEHCATCFADGVQMATGCTFGKGNIRKLGYGKFGLTLIDKKNARAVRVTPRAEVMAANKQTAFFTEYRMQGVPASAVPAEVVEPLMARVLETPTEQLFQIEGPRDQIWQDHPHDFDSFVCDHCGEMTVQSYGRILGNEKVCIPCQQKALGRQA